MDAAPSEGRYSRSLAGGRLGGPRRCRRITAHALGVQRPNAATRSCPCAAWQTKSASIGSRMGETRRKCSAHVDVPCDYRQALPRRLANRPYNVWFYPAGRLALGIDDERRSLRAGASSGLRSSRASQYRLRSSQVFDCSRCASRATSSSSGSTWSGPTWRSGDRSPREMNRSYACSLGRSRDSVQTCQDSSAATVVCRVVVHVMAVMHEHVEDRTCRQEQIQQDPEYVRAMLRPQEKRRNRDEHAEAQRSAACCVAAHHAVGHSGHGTLLFHWLEGTGRANATHRMHTLERCSACSYKRRGRRNPTTSLCKYLWLRGLATSATCSCGAPRGDA